MHNRIHIFLQHAGITDEAAVALATLLLQPPPGIIDPATVPEADDTHLALLAAMVAASNMRQFGPALRQLLSSVAAQQETLSAYDAGCFWHLQGLASWRLDRALPRATRALNRSIALLQSLHTSPAQAYLGRVFDTLAQLLHAQGLLQEARADFHRALHYKQAGHDARESLALTLGNLGRQYMTLGNFATAAKYLRRDLHVLATSVHPDANRWRTQLLSELGTCALESSRQGREAARQSRLAAAQEAFQQSATLARQHHDHIGSAFAALGLGRVALAGHDFSTVRRQGRAVQRHLRAAALPASSTASIAGLWHHLRADMALAQQQPQQALPHFRAAQRAFQQEPAATPIEVAQVLHGLARTHLLLGQPRQAATLFREALQRLDGTDAASWRARIEREMRRQVPESWLLHSTRRFVGGPQVEFLLQHAGHEGFQGRQEEVVVLFSDIRGFTSIAEYFGAVPADFMAFLNAYLRTMTRCIDDYAGMVDKFIGDAVMAVFSLPQPRPADDALRAVQAALWMREELTRFNRQRPEGLPPLDMGVGLHTGPVLAGLIGSPQKRSYTVIGDAVNTASRLESLTKHLGAAILISGEVQQRLPADHGFLLRPLGQYRLKGKETSVAVTEVMGEDDGSAMAQALKREIAHTHKALTALQKGAFAEAGGGFMTLAQHALAAGFPHRAHGYEFLAGLAAAYDATPPRAWDGVILMEEK